MGPLSRIVLLLQTISSVLAESSNSVSVNGCTRPLELGSRGFNVDYWRWEVGVELYDNDLRKITADFGHFGPYNDDQGNQISASGIEGNSLYWNYYNNSLQQWWYTAHSNVFGNDITITNFTMNMTAYYIPPTSGIYTFYLEADDDAGLRLGGARACCGNVSQNVGNKFDLFATLDGARLSVELDSNLVYPMELVYVNRLTQSRLNISVIKPGSDSYSPLENLYQIDWSKQECPVQTSTLPWQGTFTTTFVTEVPQGSSTTPVEIIETPTAGGETTTVAWTGTFPTTLSKNELKTTYDRTFTVPDVTVETPTNDIPGETTSIGYTGTTPTTISTNEVINSGSKIYTVPDVTVETPTNGIPGVTTTIGYTGSVPTTISTNEGITSGSKIYTVPDVTVETPTNGIPGETTTVAWTGSYPTTISTNEVITSGSKIYTVPDVTVETPYGFEGTTVTAESTKYTTIPCPSPTTFAYGGTTYTVMQATTLTLEDCDCTQTGSVAEALSNQPSGSVVPTLTIGPALASQAIGSNNVPSVAQPSGSAASSSSGPASASQAIESNNVPSIAQPSGSAASSSSGPASASQAIESNNAPSVTQPSNSVPEVANSGHSLEPVKGMFTAIALAIVLLH